MAIVVRVYGLLMANEHLLVSDELIRGKYITKFPGGGLELGEGTKDCLKREFKEEMDLKIEVGEHFYTTDFYQQSAFNNADQIISIYYYVHTDDLVRASYGVDGFQFSAQQLETYKMTEQIESFRWIKITELSTDNVSLPIDKIVIDKLLNQSS